MPLNTGRPGVEVEEIVYSARNREAGTTITGTAKPANPDYSHTFLWGCAAQRVTFEELVCFLWAQIDSFGGGGATLNYAIEIDGVEIKTGTLSTGGSTGWKGVAEAIYEATPTIPADVLMEVFLWVNAGSCVIHTSEGVRYSVAPGCLASTGWSQISVNPFQGSVLLDLDAYSRKANNIGGADELELYCMIGQGTVVLSITGDLYPGNVVWPGLSGISTKFVEVNVPLRAEAGVKLALYSNDYPATDMVYYIEDVYLIFYVDI